MKRHILDLSGRGRPTVASETVSADAGDCVIVRLDESPSTGYRWEWSTTLASGSPLKVIRDGFLPADTDPEVCGSPGVRELVFNAPSPCDVEVEFVYRRAWLPRSGSDPRVVVRILAT